jgi:hypothetical protein
VHPPPGEERNDPEGRNADADSPTGELPRSLEGPDVPTYGGTATDPVENPAELANPQLRAPRYRYPASTSMW